MAQGLDPVGSGSERSSDGIGRSPGHIAWARLRRDRVGMTCLVVLLAVVVIAILTPLIVRLLGVNAEYNTKLIGDGGLPKDGLLPQWNTGISADHWLGIEPVTGRDLFAELLYASRLSLLVAFLSTALTLILGTVIGLVAGYVGGRVDRAITQITDLVLSFPQLILLIALSPVFVQVFRGNFGVEGEVLPKMLFFVIVFGLFGWPYLARIIRGQVLSLREQEFIEAAVSLGASTRRILFREILPNLWVPIIVYGTLLLPVYIAAESALSFLNVGFSEPTPTWGKMLDESVKYYNVAPLYLFIPGTALFVVVLAFNLLGDSVRDALDPRAGRS
ncbi:MAG: ABC transporter permease [Angustibacter sp.]